MDSFEDLMKWIYGEKKKEDELSVPPFDSLIHRPDGAKPAPSLKLLYKLMASSAAVVITALLVLKYIDEGPPKKNSPMTNSQLINHYGAASTDRLLNTGNGLTYIWRWKSPTDGLLDLYPKSHTNN
jgi:hypothetical protein